MGDVLMYGGKTVSSYADGSWELDNVFDVTPPNSTVGYVRILFDMTAAGVGVARANPLYVDAVGGWAYTCK